MSKKEPDFLKNGSPKMRQEVQSVIEKLYGADSQVNSLMQELLTKLLGILMSSVNEEIDLSSFSQEEIQTLLKALSQALEQIDKSTDTGLSDEKIIQILLHHLVGGLANTQQKTKEDKDLQELGEKKQKEIRAMIYKLLNYENYKITSPSVIAGEAKIPSPEKDLSKSDNRKFTGLINHSKGGSGMGM